MIVKTHTTNKKLGIVTKLITFSTIPKRNSIDLSPLITPVGTPHPMVNTIMFQSKRKHVQMVPVAIALSTNGNPVIVVQVHTFNMNVKTNNFRSTTRTVVVSKLSQLRKFLPAHITNMDITPVAKTMM